MCRLLLFVPVAFLLCLFSIILSLENLNLDLELDLDSDELLETVKDWDWSCPTPPHLDPEHSIPADFKYPSYDPNDELIKILLQSLTQPPHEDIYLSVPQLIEKYKYPLETHFITTTTGYILTAYRICKYLNGISGPPVIIQHGLFSYSGCYIATAPKDNIAFVLADKGYDCWLINARGTIVSQGHTNPKITPQQYWDFSWEEMGTVDIPNVIDYILKLTHYNKLFYIGHSMGTTMFFAGMSIRPEYCDKVALMMALAPVGWLFHSTSLIRLAAPAETALAAGAPLYEPAIPGQITPNEFVKILSLFFGMSCSNPIVAENICLQAVFMLVGYDFRETNLDQLPILLAHTLNPTSLKCLRHYAQGMIHNRFARFDYGPMKNMQLYKQCDAPEYKISNINCPVALFSSGGDALANQKDVAELSRKFRNLVLNFTITENPCWNHIDYLVGNHIWPAYLQRMVDLMEEYRSKATQV